MSQALKGPTFGNTSIPMGQSVPEVYRIEFFINLNGRKRSVPPVATTDPDPLLPAS